MRDRIQHITDGLIETMIQGESSADLVASLASPLPFIVICDLLGVAEEDRTDFQSWVDILVDGQTNKVAVVDAFTHLHRYMVNVIDKKRRRPGEDLLSTLIAARDSEDRLTEDELVATSFLLMAAGDETTVNLIGNGMLALLAHPEFQARLREEPDLTMAFVDEVLRFDPPAPMSAKRFAKTDIDIDGVTIPAGDTVLLSLASANRDPKTFTQPDELRLVPGESSHLSFGHGIHYCIGAPLARLEGQIAIDTLIRRLPNIALAVSVEELQWRPSARVHGLASLPITF